MSAADIPFRIRIGVTGHRGFPEPEKLARSVMAILTSRIAEFYDRPVSSVVRATPVAFTILTPLAEGADRLVSMEALKFPSSELEVVLPLPGEDYMRDFATPESKAEFQRLLRKARKTVVLGEGVRDTGQTDIREKAYEEAGRFVVDYCDLLVALWDGKPACGRGGTSEIVAYAREKNRPLVIISTLNPDDVRIEKGIGLSSHALNQIAYFNRFPVSAAKLRSYVENIARQLFQNPEGDNIPGEMKSWIRDRLLPSYVRASLIAKQNKKRYFRAGLAVYILSPLAVAAVALGILLPTWSFPAFLVESLFLLVIYTIIRIADRKKVHKKWLEMRFLTERIRAAVFLFACGTKPAAFRISPLSKNAMLDDEWILRLFDEIIIRAGAPAPGLEMPFYCGADFARLRWVGEQIAFHAVKAVKAGKVSRFLELTGQATFLVAIFIAAWHAFSQLLRHQGFVVWLEKPVIFLAITLPTIGAAVGGIRIHREYSRLGKRSRFMGAALKELEKQFTEVAGIDELKGLLQETEQLMLQETQDWMSLMKFARIEAN